MMVLYHLTAPHKLIVKSVLALAFKFLGTETSLEQIERLICSMTTAGGDERIESKLTAGHGDFEGQINPKVVDGVLKELLQYLSTVLHVSTESDDAERSVDEVYPGARLSASPQGVRVLMSLFARSPSSLCRTAKVSTTTQVLRIDSLSDNRTIQALDILMLVINHCNRECWVILKLALHLRKVTNLAYRSAVKKRTAFDYFRDPFDDDEDGQDDYDFREGSVHRDDLDHDADMATSIARLAAMEIRVSCCFVSALFSLPIDVLTGAHLWLVRRSASRTPRNKPSSTPVQQAHSSSRLLVMKRSSLALNKLDALQLNIFTILSEIDKPYHKVTTSSIRDVA